MKADIRIKIKKCFDARFSIEHTQLVTGMDYLYVLRKYREFEAYYRETGQGTFNSKYETLEYAKKIEKQLFEELERQRLFPGHKNKIKYLSFIYSKVCAH